MTAKKITNKIKEMLRTILEKRMIARLQRGADEINGIVGSAMVPFMRKRVEAITNDKFTIGTEGNPLDTLLRAGVAHRAMKKGNVDQIASFHRRFWAGTRGKIYHDQHMNAFQTVFIPNFSYVVDELNILLHQRQGFNTVCEIGSGSGQLINYLAGSVSHVRRFIGIDLNLAVTEENKRKYQHTTIEFIAADADAWIREHGERQWIFITHRGVLEYLPQRNLEALLNFIAGRLAPAIFIAIEPVGFDHDLDTSFDSVTYGSEFSFSHNYPYLMTNAGFKVVHTKTKDLMSHRICTVIAIAGL